jgi:hypothetical protein
MKERPVKQNNIFIKIFRFFYPKGGYIKNFNDGMAKGKQATFDSANKVMEKRNKNKKK